MNIKKLKNNGEHLMVHDYETIEEQVRNKITPIYNLIEVLRNLQNPKTSEHKRKTLYEYLINEKELPDICEKNIKQLIEIANSVDEILTDKILTDEILTDKILIDQK